MKVFIISKISAIREFQGILIAVKEKVQGMRNFSIYKISKKEVFKYKENN